MAFRFEFDPVDKILLGRFEGRLTDESAAEFYAAIRKYSTETGAYAGIWDFSCVTEFAMSSEFVHELARSEPAMPDADKRPRLLVASDTVGLGIMRIFEIVRGPKGPLLLVVHTLDEAFDALGVQSPQFEPLE
jgi:hypothetical protein